jgi:transposase
MLDTIWGYFMSRKLKYTFEFKKECIDLIIRNHQTCLSVSKEKGLHKSILERWLMRYKTYGYVGLLPKKNNSYSVAFKLKVLNHITKDHLSVRQACIVYDIGSESVILNWRRRYKSLGLEGLKDKPKGRRSPMSKSKIPNKKSRPLTREEELLIENKSLKAELALLKKLHALAQARGKNR